MKKSYYIKGSINLISLILILIISAAFVNGFVADALCGFYKRQPGEYGFPCYFFDPWKKGVLIASYPLSVVVLFFLYYKFLYLKFLRLR